MKLYMFRKVPLSIIRFASCQQNCMTYTIAVCTVNNSWWWTEELSETCRVSFQNKIWEISASSWFHYTWCGRKVMRLAKLCTKRKRCCLPLHMAV